jgi:hypothetical protein
MADDVKSGNAFSLEYLDAVREKDDPLVALEAETAEPWEVRESGSSYGLFHPWESPDQGDTPQAAFRYRETALLFRLIWPALGRDRLFRLSATPRAEGFPVEADDQVVGSLRHFNPEAVFAAHVGSHLLRSPYSLAVLLWLSGPNTQKQVGRILARMAADGGPKEVEGALRPQ